ncbi:Ankyrin-2 [Xylographa bjoerkii]|nr:Ankyrin-2 [Xylographa bjoerkii]
MLELVRKGADLNIRNRAGMTPLFHVCSYAIPKIALALMKERVRLCSATHLAADSEDLAIPSSLEEEEADLAVTTCYGYILTNAAREGDLDTLTYLLDYGVDVDAKGSDGQTAIQAVISGRVSCDSTREAFVSLLIQTHANLEFKDKNGDTVLHLAITKNYKRIAAMLLKGGASKDTKNGMNCNALRWAKGRGRKDIIAMLQ